MNGSSGIGKTVKGLGQAVVGKIRAKARRMSWKVRSRADLMVRDLVKRYPEASRKVLSLIDHPLRRTVVRVQEVEHDYFSGLRAYKEGPCTRIDRELMKKFAMGFAVDKSIEICDGKIRVLRTGLTEYKLLHGSRAVGKFSTREQNALLFLPDALELNTQTIEGIVDFLSTSVFGSTPSACGLVPNGVNYSFYGTAVLYQA